ncbi:hypothetical protein F4808DRAFT_476492 [Astrocystis sublimbata]|nr:hypothetical protein F4808DRAFT_476492 [Astrocystis sublimbata]
MPVDSTRPSPNMAPRRQSETQVQEPPNAQEPQPQPPPPKATKSWGFHLAFTGLALAVFVFQVDATALGISIPTIADELHGTSLEERSLWLGMMGIPIAVGNVTGPIISALFTSRVTWRWLGWLNLPVLGVSLPLLIVFLRMKAVDHDVPARTKLQRMDWIGMTLSVVGIVAFVLPLSWLGSLYPISSWRSIVPLVLGILTLAVFLWYERRPKYPIVPLRIFTNRTAAMTLSSAFVHGMLSSAILQYIPLVYQSVELQSVLDSAVSILPARSWVILTVGTGILALFDVGSTLSQLRGYPILWGTGVALLRLLILLIQASVKNVDDTGLATSILLLVRFVGSLIGLAIASTTFNTEYSRNLPRIVEYLKGPLGQLEHPDQAIAFIPQLKLLQNQVDPDVLTKILEVYLEAFRTVFYVLTGISGLGFITSLFIQELSLANRESSAQAFEEK